MSSRIATQCCNWEFDVARSNMDRNLAAAVGVWPLTSREVIHASSVNKAPFSTARCVSAALQGVDGPHGSAASVMSKQGSDVM